MRSGNGSRPCCRARNARPVRRVKDTSLLVEAVFWRARCGVSWRDLPAERFSPWLTVYAGFRCWRQAGVWSQVLAQVQHETGLHRLSVDSTIVRAHQVAAGTKKKTARSGRRLAAVGAASPPSCTCVATRRAAFVPWP